METVLKNWGLEKLWPIFQQHEIIEIDHLKDYLSVSSPDDVKELFPIAGLRARLLKKFSEQFKFQTVTSQVDTQPLSASPGTLTFDLPSTSHYNIDTSSEVVVVDNDKADLSNYILTQNNIIDLSPPQNIVEPLKVSTVTFTNSDINTDPPKKKKKVSHIGYVDLGELLNDHPLGPSVLSYYKAFSELDNRIQGRLCDIVSLFYLRRYGMVLKESDLEKLAKDFIILFPNECVESYFIPSETKKASKTGKAVGAKGKLVNSYKNNCTTIREGLYWEEQAALKSASRSRQAGATEELTPSENSKSWLVNNRDVENVLIHWDSCYLLRRAEITSNKFKSVTDIYEDWPILKENIGVQLIEKDFIKLFGSISLSAVWEESFNKLIKYFKDKSKQDISDLDLLDNPNLNQDYKNILQTKILTNLLAPKSNRVSTTKPQSGKNNNGFWRPKPDDSEKNVFVHVKIPGDIEKIVRKKAKRFGKLGLQVQPFVIIVGADLESINAFYVRVDCVQYELKSFLHCLEFILQLSLVFQISYSVASENFWYYLQNGVYKITSDSDTRIPFVLDLINKLKRR